MSNDEHPIIQRRLPDSGRGSAASWPRRFFALMADWIAANILAYAVTGGAEVWNAGSSSVWVPLVCWYGLVVVSTAAVGASLGQVVLGIRIVHLDGHRISPITAAVRTLLIALVIPPLVFDADRRGLHDLASNTAAVNA